MLTNQNNEERHDQIPVIALKELLRPDEVARLLNISRWTVYRWVKEGQLKASKIGRGSLRVFRSSVNDLIVERKI